MAFDIAEGGVEQVSEATKSKTHQEKLDSMLQLMAADRAVAGDQRTVPVTGANGAWLVVVTKAAKERSVHDRLVAQGFEVFLPLQPLTEVQAQRKGVAAVPFFTRTLFARATLDAYRWQAIFSTIGVQRVMCDPAKPKGVTDAFVQRLRAHIFDQFLAIGLIDPNRPAVDDRTKVKDRRKWVKLVDVVEGLVAVQVADQRESILASLLSEGHEAIVQALRR